MIIVLFGRLGQNSALQFSKKFIVHESAATGVYLAFTSLIQSCFHNDISSNYNTFLMTATLLVTLEISDPSELQLVSDDVHDDLVAAGHDVVDVKPWFRPVTGQEPIL